MSSKWTLRISLCICALFLTPAAWSQAITSLSGVVTDPSGAAIPGATVNLLAPLTGAARTATTDNAGEYSFPQLAPGRYQLTVTAQGFATAKKPPFDLLVSQPATINMTLPVGTTSTEVTVTAGGQPVLNTTDATLGNTFEGKQIQDLPIEARNVPDLLSLQPGVTFMGRTDNYSGSTAVGNNGGDSRSGSTNGGRSDQSNITLDGVDVNDVNSGYAFTSVLRVTQDSVGEFRVTTSNPNAEEGRSSGAQVALVTKSGTNDIHGAVYEYNRNNVFHANDFFNKQTQLAQGKPNTPLKLIRNVYGADVGGPIKKDRAFYFLNYEGRRDTQGFVSNGDTVPNAAYRNGLLQYVCADPAACPGDANTPSGYFVLTPQQIQSMDPQGIGENAAALAVFNQYPVGNNPTRGDKLTTEGYSFAYNANRSYNTYIARLDWNIDRNGKHTVYWRGNLQNDSEPGGPQFPGQPASSTTLTNNKGFAAGYTYLISPSLVNTVVFGLTRQGYSNSGLMAAPYVDLQGITSLNAHSSTDSTIVPVYNLADNFTWNKHNHNFAFGTNIRFISDKSSSNSLSYSNASGTYQYLNPAAIAGSKGPFDPAAYGFPAVDSGYWGNYNSAIMGIVGIIM